MNWNEWLSKCGFEKPDEFFPKSVGKQDVAFTDDDRAAAWEMYTELRTRITCQPLHYLAGDEQTALESVAGLFKLSRELIRKYGRGSRQFALLTVFVLNRHIRPFTAKWHKAVTDGRFAGEDLRHEFRESLQSTIQPGIRLFASALARMAENEDFRAGSESWPDAAPESDSSANDIPFDILFDIGVSESQQHAMRWWEHNAIRSRRNRVKLEPSAPSTTTAPAPPLPTGKERLTNLAGLAISGGGLRSATFSLGALQLLAEKNILREFDYLSTVSGGGYIGSFLSSYLNTTLPGIGTDGRSQPPFHNPPVGESDALRHLRAHSKFLLTGGWMGRLIMGLQAVYGLFANIMIVLAWLTTAVLIFGYFFGDRIREQAKSCNAIDFLQYLKSMPWLGIVWSVIALLLIIMPFILRCFAGPKRAGVIAWYQRITAGASAVALAVTGAALIPLLFRLQEMVIQGQGEALRSPWLWTSLGSTVLLQRFATALTWVRSQGRWFKVLTYVLLTVSGPLVFLLVFLIIGRIFLVSDVFVSPVPSVADLWPLAALAGALLFYSHLVLDINLSSLHPFYRDRLAEAYLIQPRDSGPAAVVQQKLSELRKQRPAVPYHLINATLNAPAGKSPALRGRKSDFFLFSQAYCGSPATGYFKTEDFEKEDRRLDLATAMAISGGAASPFMGTNANPASVLFAILNIRLDYWLPIPGRRRIPLVGWRPGPWHLFRQVAGYLTETSAFVNLSDGGHIENLGVYELLRRRCKFIVAIDGECDPEITCGSLVNVCRLARIDFGIEINIDLARLRRSAEGVVPFHFTIGTIEYPDSGGKLVGYLLYLKSSVTGNEENPVARYRAAYPDFPHQSTADLFYDEAQFEAYRALGHHIAKEPFRRELIGSNEPPKDIADWFSKLLTNLYEPSRQ